MGEGWFRFQKGLILTQLRICSYEYGGGGGIGQYIEYGGGGGVGHI